MKFYMKPASWWTISLAACAFCALILHPAPSVWAGPVPTSVISYWNFDESSGLALDSADSNDGTLGASVSRVAGIVGTGALAFGDTNTSTVGVGSGTGNNFSVTAGIAIEALIVPTWDGAMGSFDEIFRKEDGNPRILFSFQNDNPGIGPVLALGLNIGSVYAELDMPLDGLSGRPTLAQLTDGNAHHVVGTYDSVTGAKAIYVDGTLRFSTTLAAGSLISSGGPAGAAIGSFGPAGGESFTGIIDEVAIWDRGLSAVEIGQHYGNVLAGENYFFTPVPEPSSFALTLAAMACLGLVRYRRRHRIVTRGS